MSAEMPHQVGVLLLVISPSLHCIWLPMCSTNFPWFFCIFPCTCCVVTAPSSCRSFMWLCKFIPTPSALTLCPWLSASLSFALIQWTQNSTGYEPRSLSSFTVSFVDLLVTICPADFLCPISQDFPYQLCLYYTPPESPLSPLSNRLGFRKISLVLPEIFPIFAHFCGTPSPHQHPPPQLHPTT